jgi:hypothetical protein
MPVRVDPQFGLGYRRHFLASIAEAKSARPELMPLDDPDNPLAVEIQQETAATYFAACRKMVDALEALKAFDRSVASATRDDEQNHAQI